MKEPGKRKTSVDAALDGLAMEFAPPAPVSSEPKPQESRKGRGSSEVVTVTVKLRRDEWRRLKMKALAENTTLQETAEGGAPLRSHRTGG
jgi:hypothetical protein